MSASQKVPESALYPSDPLDPSDKFFETRFTLNFRLKKGRRASLCFILIVWPEKVSVDQESKETSKKSYTSVRNDFCQMHSPIKNTCFVKYTKNSVWNVFCWMHKPVRIDFRKTLKDSLLKRFLLNLRFHQTFFQRNTKIFSSETFFCNKMASLKKWPKWRKNALYWYSGPQDLSPKTQKKGLL